MTRAKETEPGSEEIPDYKSHPSRIVISQRKAYNNLRLRSKEKTDLVNSLRGNKRDLEQSRDKWKKEAREKDQELSARTQEFEAAQKRIEELETRLKKTAQAL